MNRPKPLIRPRLWTRRSILLALAGSGLAVPACEFSDLFSWNDGKPTIFGYRTAPNYDRRYKTIRVKMFKNPTFWSAVPVPGLEEQLTLYIVRQIEQRTPYKVVSGDADTELAGAIMNFLQVAVNYTQLNEIRQVETTMTCAVSWKDLRTGKFLSQPGGVNPEPPPPAGLLPGQQDPLNPNTTMPGSLQSQELSAAPISPGGNPATLAQTSPPPTTGTPVPGQTNAPGPQGGAPAPSPGGGGVIPLAGSVMVRSVASYTPEIGQSLATAEQDNCNQMAQQIVNMMESGW
jgi:hypothetical protein